MPGSVLTSLVCDPLCDSTNSDAFSSMGLVSSVPIYDSESEEIFGYVLMVCDIESILRKQLGRGLSAGEVVVTCDIFNTITHVVDGRLVEDTQSKLVDSHSPHFMPAIKHLQDNMDYADVDQGIYGARLWFIPNKHGIMYLLKRSS